VDARRVTDEHGCDETVDRLHLHRLLMEIAWRPVDGPEQLYLAIQHASARFRALDRELGLSPARFNLLAAIRYDGPQRIGDPPRREGVSQPSVTQTVRGLEEAGLVVRVAHPDDRRGSVVELTPAGRALVRRARARKIAWVRSSTRGVDAADARA